MKEILPLVFALRDMEEERLMEFDLIENNITMKTHS